MSKFIRIIPLLLFITVLCQGQSSEKDKIREVFVNYKSAIRNGKGEDALKYLDSTSIKYYTGILNIIKSADSAKVSSLSLLDKMIVLSIRHDARKEEIILMKGLDVFLYALKKGMIGNASNFEIGDILMDKNVAKCQIFSKGSKSNLYFVLHKEKEHWKLNVTSLFDNVNLAIKHLIEDSGASENEYLYLLLESMNGKKPGNEIWQPIE